jgi:hypothetical protein
MRCGCHQEVIRELEELAAWCEAQWNSDDHTMPERVSYSVAGDRINEAITKRRASMQPVRYQETVR